MREEIITDYHGGAYYFEENKEKELTIFIVDDDPFYLNLLVAQISKNEKFEIFTFPTGEECLNALQLKPDLVILDYHLDSVTPYAKKGDEIAEQIKSRMPKAEILMMSSDHKLPFIKKLKEENQSKIFYKDGYIKEKAEGILARIASKRKGGWLNDGIFFFMCGVTVIIITFIYIKFMT
jgi:DNA-binding NarL/FixJ family response regulator